jgi:hypothetical protein
MADKPKRIGDGTSKAAAKYLLDTGLLFEINRTVLHPLGLALSVECDDETEEVNGFAYLWDSTDDSEGICFSTEILVEGRKKLDGYLAERDVKKLYEERKKALGYIIQPIPSREDG